MNDQEAGIWYTEELQSFSADAENQGGFKGPKFGGSFAGLIHIQVKTEYPRWKWLPADGSSSATGNDSRMLLIRLGFQFVIPLSLHEGGFRVVWARCSALAEGDSRQSPPLVIDVLPRHFTSEEPVEVEVGIGAEGKVGLLRVPAGAVGIDSTTLQPVIVGYPGDNQREPFWEIRPKGPDFLGARTFWMMVSVPAACCKVLVSVMAEIEVRKEVLKVYFGPKLRRFDERPNFEIPVPPVEMPSEGASRRSIGAQIRRQAFDVSEPRATGGVERVRKILFLAASPTETDRLRLDREAREIEERLRSGTHRDHFEFVSRWATRPRDLFNSLNEITPTFVHFCGHGNCQGILLEDDQGYSKPVSASDLSEVFATFRDVVRVVVLNACYSAGQADSLVKQIDFLVGNEGRIDDDDAISFASQFYSALAYGRTVEDAFNQASSYLSIQSTGKAPPPVLRTRE